MPSDQAKYVLIFYYVKVQRNLKPVQPFNKAIQLSLVILNFIEHKK